MDICKAIQGLADLAVQANCAEIAKRATFLATTLSEADPVLLVALNNLFLDQARRADGSMAYPQIGKASC